MDDKIKYITKCSMAQHIDTSLNAERWKEKKVSNRKLRKKHETIYTIYRRHRKKM